MINIDQQSIPVHLESKVGEVVQQWLLPESCEEEGLVFSNRCHNSMQARGE